MGPLKANPSSGREEDLNLGPPDYKTSALPLGHARLHVYCWYNLTLCYYKLCQNILYVCGRKKSPLPLLVMIR